jgi:hypothetical protein
MAPPLVLPDGWMLISFLAFVCRPCRWELSRLLNSIGGRQAAKAKRELAGTEVRLVDLGAGLKGWLRESMCRDQDLAREGGLGGVVVAGAAADVEVELWCQRFDSRQACWAASTAAQPSSREPDLLSGPVGGRPSPDWWTRGGESTVGDELLWAGEAADLADLDRDGQGEQLGDAGDRVQQHRARVGLGERLQLGVQRRDPLVENVDQRETLADRAAPDPVVRGFLCIRLVRPAGS